MIINLGFEMRITLLALITSFLFSNPAGKARPPKHPYKRSSVDMPVSLADQVVITRGFLVHTELYDIIIQVEKPLPFIRLMCMLGVTTSPLDLPKCSKGDPILQADWEVFNGDKMLAEGSMPNHPGAAFDKDAIYTVLGHFMGEEGGTYSVKVKFTKDGSALDVANPHLIVIRHQYMFG